MSRVLLLYDIDDRDFARDIADLLGALDVDVVMIPRAPDGGTTLQQKEASYFASVDAALFLLTPGSERHGKKYPSPSVADEMGQARERFGSEPWRVIYFVDSECAVQAVDQKAYVGFTRSDHRSVIEAVRMLVLALKDAGVIATQVPAAPEKPPEVDARALAGVLSPHQRELLLQMSRAPSGSLFYHDFVALAGRVHGNPTDGNLTVRELLGGGLVSYAPGIQGVGGTASANLSGLGWEVVRLLRAVERATEQAAARARMFRSPVGPVPRGGPGVGR